MPTSVDSRRLGSEVIASEPMPLDTFTITGAADVGRGRGPDVQHCLKLPDGGQSAPTEHQIRPSRT